MCLILIVSVQGEPDRDSDWDDGGLQQKAELPDRAPAVGEECPGRPARWVPVPVMLLRCNNDKAVKCFSVNHSDNVRW